ncbi:MAG: hypothetical protein ONB44_18895 [candidate division KSB1 bacterium]|nr:hypothetical protein [candidate division KSB1 bacterium]MDZ7304199.1 hypothetical protein [candidate division KSB1 bacterium]MDZ7313431.1 hypothetical protein [candidate division KSB1 bacterium]
MRLSYDPEGDILEVIFDERLHRASKKAYRLRHGIVLYLAKDSLRPVQLTLVNYRALAQFPQFECEFWHALSASDKALLKPILASSAVSAFFKFDPDTGCGQIATSAVPEIFSFAA